MTGPTSAYHYFTVGRFECYALSDGIGVPRRGMFVGSVNVGASDGARAEGRIPVASYPAPRTCMLIRAPGTCVLIDTGAGSTARDEGQLRHHLTRVGVSTDDVETVILTHAHLGHAGGALDADGQPMYANARYVLGADEWEFWMSRPDLRSRRLQRVADRIYASLAALRNRVMLVAGGNVIIPGVQAVAAPGHSAGHLAISLSSEGHELLCLGDTVLAPRHLERPSWYTRYDLRPEQAVASRVRLLDRAAASGALVQAYHFPYPGLGWVRQEGRAWRWEPKVHER